MGYVAHHAIVATAWQDGAAQALAEYAASIGAEALVGEPRTNGYQTVCITSDGSKEGWQSSADGDEQRNQIIEWMRAHDSLYFEWVEVRYGKDDGSASIARHAWEPTPSGKDGGVG